MPDRIGRLYDACMVVLGLLCVAALFSVLPFATQDGPAHLTFGNFLGLDPATHPLLAGHYRTNGTLHPNSAVYLLIAALRQFFSPDVSEALVQVLCTVGVVVSGWFALRQVSDGVNARWSALLVFPLALNRLFFFGTYNFCLSVAGFLLVVGTFLRLQKQPSFGRALTVAAALYFTFFAHAGGFVAAGVALAALVLAHGASALQAGKAWGALLRAQRLNLLVLFSPLPLILLALSSSAGTPIAYGVPLDRRLTDLALLEALRVNDGPGKELATFLLNPLLAGGVLVLAFGVWFRRQSFSSADVGRDASGALAVAIAMLLLALTFPDMLGGGWIHFQRMALFPYFAAVLCLAYCPVPKKLQPVIASVAGIVTVTLLADAVTAQREIARQMEPLVDVDRIVGEHCSVLPLVLSLKPFEQGGRTVDVGYNPYLHVGSRLEFERDRVALFNYQARTPLYPVRFREGHDTQALIFHWPPGQRALGIHTVDIRSFEESSGMAVDYILQWGPLGAASPELQEQVRQAEQGARRVYESKDGMVLLFRRPMQARSRCGDERQPAGAGGR